MYAKNRLVSNLPCFLFFGLHTRKQKSSKNGNTSIFRRSSTSVYYAESKQKKKKKGRPRNVGMQKVPCYYFFCFGTQLFGHAGRGVASYPGCSPKKNTKKTAWGVDIANIKVVVVYGLPDTLSQLYQVITITLDVCKK